MWNERYKYRVWFISVLILIIVLFYKSVFGIQRLFRDIYLILD